MNQFLKKLLYFSLPILVFLSIPAAFLYFSGENYKSIDSILQEEENYLIGYAYNEANYSYIKAKELDLQNTNKLVALGSSRVLQFRAPMFTSSFYNAGYTISSISDFVPFIETHLKNKKPEALLISLDQWMFNENWDNLATYNPLQRTRSENFIKNPSAISYFKVWMDLLKGKYGLEIFNQKSHKNQQVKIGLNAVVNNTGFRKDGSMFYGKQIQLLLNNDSLANDYNYSDTYNRIENGNRRFEYANQVHEKSLAVLDVLLAYCKENNIQVVAFIPPFADAVNNKLTSSGKYEYLEQIYPETKPYFEKYGFELWDMSNLSKYGSSDQETIDGFHGGELCYAKMLHFMLENGSLLKNYTKQQQLAFDIKNKKNALEVY